MKHEDLIKKLENLKPPEIELPGHRQALKMALLSSGRFRERIIAVNIVPRFSPAPAMAVVMDWAKTLAPVATAVLLIAVMGFFAVNTPESVVPFEPANLGGNQINRFSSYEELQEFVKANTQNIASRWMNDFRAF